MKIKLDHVRLDVLDLDRAHRFYESVLALEVIVRYDVPTHSILQLGPGGRPPGVELWQEDGSPPEPHRRHHIAFSVEDVPATVGIARRLGYAVLRDVYHIGTETLGFLLDPDGHIVEVNDFRGRGIGEAGE